MNKNTNKSIVMAEAIRIMLEVDAMQQPNIGHSYVVPISREFGMAAGTNEHDALLDMLFSMYRKDPIYMSGLRDQKGIFAFFSGGKLELKKYKTASSVGDVILLTNTRKHSILASAVPGGFRFVTVSGLKREHGECQWNMGYYAKTLSDAIERYIYLNE